MIITDQKMPGISGLETLEIVKQLSPKTIRMLLSASIERGAIENTSAGDDLFYYSPKPIDLVELLKNIELGIDQYNKS